MTPAEFWASLEEGARNTEALIRERAEERLLVLVAWHRDVYAMGMPPGSTLQEIDRAVAAALPRLRGEADAFAREEILRQRSAA